MNSWNPATKARNFVARMREMSDGVVALRAELAQLRAKTDALQESAVDAQRSAIGLREQVDRLQRVTSRAARRGTLQREQVRVVFLVHNVDAWDSIGEVIEIMRSAPDFDPVVLAIPHHYAGSSAPRGEGRVHRFLAERGIPHLRLRNEDVASATELLLAIDPDVVFRQSQWDADVDEAFSADRLAWTRLAIVPYETVNPTVNVPWGNPPINSALDQQLHRACWLVFCANEDVLQLARSDTLTGARQYRAVGHPKADAVRATTPSWPLTVGAPRPRRVLWSAHHSILNGWNDFGMFPLVKDEMLRWAAEDPGSEFVFTHHPHLRGTIRKPNGPISNTEFEQWLDAWRTLPNASYSRDPYAPLLAATDLLVTDGPSMITEAQLLSVPTVFLERADHIPFNQVGEMIVTGVHRVADVSAARRAADELADRPDPLKPVQRANVERLFGPPGAAQRIVETVRAEARAERSRSR